MKTKKLNVLMITPECVPFAKTGGLADVVGALPASLKKLGHDVRIVMPLYGTIDRKKFNLTVFMKSLCVWMGNKEEWCSVLKGEADGGVAVYFIEYNNYFQRDGLYHDKEFNDYYDNPRRFAFLTRAALQLAIDMKFKTDIVHAHDWQTALASVYLKVWHWDNPIIGKAASLLTIHNIGYQGTYGKEHYDYVGLQWGNFTSDKLEDHGRMNYLKGGIVYSEMVNTVSPTYAKETLDPMYAYGMAPYLNNKGENYTGIINGVDYDHWSPDVDGLIPAKYSINSMEGKKICKKDLQKRFGLDVNDNIPIIGVVSRFASQKGLDLLAQAIEPIINNMAVQFAILGSGDKNLEIFYQQINKKYPSKVGVIVGYNNEVAHWIEAGSDFFIMPSMYEPCGLNQIYSLKYGTLPIVRATGGLDDTVEQYNELTGDGTGFKFWELSVGAIYYTVGWAVSTFYDRPKHMKKMIKNAMQKHFSWEDSAKAYEKAYFRAIENKKNG